MTIEDEVLELADLLRQLRERDHHCRVFGSDHHQYKLGPTISERDLSSFEARNSIRLPEDYRLYLTRVGNGGAGPCYGIQTLDDAGYRDLSIPFPLTKATVEYSSDELQRYGDRDEYTGILELCHHGCAIYSYLVVNGATYGMIWEGREDFYPRNEPFALWFREWAERALRVLENDRFLGSLRIGMSFADVHRAVRAKWEQRSSPFDSSMTLLEASEIPVQLTLDRHGIVVKVEPWQFI